MFPSLCAVVWLSLLAPDLLDLSRPPGPAGLPAEWRLRAVRGHQPPTFTIAKNAVDGTRLAIRGRNQAAWIWRDLPVPVMDGSASLEWTWRVLLAPASADLREKRRDDAPLRVFVVFGTMPDMARGKARAIFYSWGGDEPDGYAARSHVSHQIMIVRLAGTADVGAQWRHAVTQPFVDYRRLWSASPPPIRAVGLMQGTDQTGAPAEAELRGLRWAMPDTIVPEVP